MERFAREGGAVSVEFFDRGRFAEYASIGDNILFGYSADPTLTLDRLPGDPHFRRVVVALDLWEPLLTLGADVARETVEIFKGMPAEYELFTNFSLITSSELPDYTRLVSRLDRTTIAALPAADQERLIALALRLVPARHRLGHIDDAFMAKVVAARHRYAGTLPEGHAPFVPYERDRYFAQGTLLENLLFGKVIATSSVAVKKANALVGEVIAAHGLSEVVREAGLGFQVGLAGSRLSPAQRQKIALARALTKRPHILILDEAVSALEPDKRTAVHQRIREAMKGRTLISVVGHPHMARGFDRVVVLDGGKVTEVGSFQELTTRDTLFRQLVAQAGPRGEGEAEHAPAGARRRDTA
jgi:ABC-type thiamine transport system ATPase subunit